MYPRNDPQRYGRCHSMLLLNEWVRSVSLNLQSFVNNGNVSIISEKFSKGRKTFNKTETRDQFIICSTLEFFTHIEMSPLLAVKGCNFWPILILMVIEQTGFLGATSIVTRCGGTVGSSVRILCLNPDRDRPNRYWQLHCQIKRMSHPTVLPPRVERTVQTAERQTCSKR